MATHQHRSSNTLRQSNKKHKSNSTSKRAIKQKQGGKVSKAGIKKAAKFKMINSKRSGNEAGSKKARKLLQKEKLRNDKEVGFGDGAALPSIITLVNLSSRNDNLEDIISEKLKSTSENNENDVYYYPNIKSGLRIYSSKSSSQNDLISILDTCRISNHVIFLIKDGEGGVDDRSSYICQESEVILSSIKAQGLPLSNLHVLYLNNNTKRKKYVQRVMNAEFPSSNIKVYVDGDYRTMIRSISNSKNDVSNFISSVPRSFIVSEEGWECNGNELSMKGYIRNAPLNPDYFLHVVNVGTCTIRKVCDVNQNLLYENKGEVMNGVEFANPNALEGEQNLVGFDETNDIDEEEEKKPSDYFSPWFDIIDSKEELDDHKSLINAFNTPSVSNQAEDDENNYDNRKLHQSEEQKFPDEIDIQPSELARERLARYRSLKSFRKSYIDPKENLPEDYARIFHFENFKGTKKDVLRDVLNDMEEALADDIEMKDDAPPSTYIPVGTLVIITVSIHTSHLPTKPLLSATSLLPHENKVSVLHMSLNPIITDQDKPPIVKSKDVITIRCGWRTFQAKPIFSQHNLNCDKHKLERFMPNGFSCMSVYGPVTYTPCPVLIFQNDTLVASGNLTDVDADRIIIKRCVITGYPTRVNKRWATVKYMFYNPEDVKWFKPAGLSTKHGLHGNIMESIGEHGSMKCLFNMPIKQHDTVCLPLYKRVYPKFVSVDEDCMDDGTMKTRKLDLVVW